jgi:hypothetical protein
VLTYRTGRGGRVATSDMARAIDYVRTDADELGVVADGYSVWGSSAGARMAASIGSPGADAYGGGEHPAPATAEAEDRVVPGLGHGFGAGAGTEVEGWIAAAVEFWARQIEDGS